MNELTIWQQIVHGITRGRFRFRRPCLLAKSRLQSHRGLQGTSTQWDEVFSKYFLLLFLRLCFHEILLKFSSSFMLYVSHPLISWFATFWSMNITWYLLNGLKKTQTFSCFYYVLLYVNTIRKTDGNLIFRKVFLPIIF